MSAQTKYHNQPVLVDGLESIIYNGCRFTRNKNSKTAPARKYFKTSPTERGKFGYTLYHKAIFEDHYGKLPPGFDVHHLDNDPDNNSIDNLAAVSRKDHMGIHKNDRSVPFDTGKLCPHCGKPIIGMRNFKKFCSMACLENYRYHSGMDDEDRTCAICGKTFSVNKYRKTQCCSRECAFKLGRSHRGELC